MFFQAKLEILRSPKDDSSGDLMHRFAHLSDCHIGAWRDLTLRELNIKAFEKAMNRCVEEKVDFIVISGDLFDANIPDLSSVIRAASKMREVREHNIPIYTIYGSHDYSATTVSIVDVLQSAGLFEKVVNAEFIEDKLKLNFFTDPKTKAKLTGISGRKTGLERTYFEQIDRESIRCETGFKIFLFHTAVEEFKPLDYIYAESIPLSEVPQSFQYCAGGHIHKRIEQHSEDSGYIVWPGPLFGSTFKDLEDSSNGERRGFYIIDFDDQEVRKLSFEEVKVCDIIYETISADGKTANQVEHELKEFASNVDCRGKVVLLRISGILTVGKPSDIDFQSALEEIRKKDPLVVVPNRNGLTTKEQEPVRVTGESRVEIETNLFKERIGAYRVDASLSPTVKAALSNRLEGNSGLNLAVRLLSILRSERKENEKAGAFEERIWQEMQEALRLEELE